MWNTLLKAFISYFKVGGSSNSVNVRQSREKGQLGDPDPPLSGLLQALPAILAPFHHRLSPGPYPSPDSGSIQWQPVTRLLNNHSLITLSQKTFLSLPHSR